MKLLRPMLLRLVPQRDFDITCALRPVPGPTPVRNPSKHGPRTGLRALLVGGELQSHVVVLVQPCINSHWVSTILSF